MIIYSNSEKKRLVNFNVFSSFQKKFIVNERNVIFLKVYQCFSLLFNVFFFFLCLYI